MQILRIILMVCFVFTVYPSIGEAQNSRVGINKGGDEPPASDLLTIETTSQPALHKSDKARSLESESLQAELPLGKEELLRAEPPNPQKQVSPWLQSTIEPKTDRQPLIIQDEIATGNIYAPDIVIGGQETLSNGAQRARQSTGISAESTVSRGALVAWSRAACVQSKR